MPSGIIISAALKRMSASDRKLLYYTALGMDEFTCVRTIFHYSELQMSQRKDIASLYRDKAEMAIGDLHQWFRLLSHGVRIVF